MVRFSGTVEKKERLLIGLDKDFFDLLRQIGRFSALLDEIRGLFLGGCQVFPMQVITETTIHHLSQMKGPPFIEEAVPVVTVFSILEERVFDGASEPVIEVFNGLDLEVDS